MDNPLTNPRVARGLEAIKTLSVNLVTQLNQVGIADASVERAISAFARHQSKVLSSLLTSAGAAGGAWAALSLWTGSLGIWGSMGYALGLVTAPAWIPVAGGAVGLTAAGGALFAALNLRSNKARKEKMQAIIGFSKELLGQDSLDEADREAMEDLLSRQQTSGKDIAALLATPPQVARQVASKLKAADQLEVARHIFPLVYAASGVITPPRRRAFDRICAHLNLARQTARQISSDYRKNLERQWGFIEALIRQTNPLANGMGFDHREMEAVLEQLEQLTYFDPRRSSQNRRGKVLGRLGRFTNPLPPTDPAYEATALSAYALAQSAIYKPERLDQLDRIFDQLTKEDSTLSTDRQHNLSGLRHKIGRIFSTTRQQIANSLNQ